MKKDDVIIITCNVCGAMSHAIKTKIPKGYYVKDEFVLCKICFGDLKWDAINVTKFWALKKS